MQLKLNVFLWYKRIFFQEFNVEVSEIELNSLTFYDESQICSIREL